MPFATSKEDLRDLLSISPKARDLLVAIDGLSGSGKSTLAGVIADMDPRVTVVQMDDFYRPIEEEEALRLTPAEGYARFFDWQRLRDQVLVPLSNSESSIAYQVYNWGTKQNDRWVEFRPIGVVIIEGVYSNRSEIRNFFDRTIYVDTPESVRRARIEARQQNPLELRERWLAAEQYYSELEKPALYASLRITGK